VCLLRHRIEIRRRGYQLLCLSELLM